MSTAEHYDPNSGRIGFWLFMSTEVVLFGGLFFLYIIYRFLNPAAFHEASLELSVPMGALNTLILNTSGLTSILAVYYFRKNRIDRTKALLALTILLGIVFLVIKGFEWAAKFHHGLYPNSPVLLAQPKGEILYFGLYFMMTGLHALHMIVAIGLFITLTVFVSKGKLRPDRPVVLENSVLYWHLVDVVWIFLFPMFYLIS